MKKICKVLFLVLMSQNLVGQFQICNSSVSKDLHDVWFIDQNIGIAVGDSGTIVRSIDGGLNWTLVMSIDSISLKKVKFFDSQNGIAIGTNIYRTHDAGLSWSNIPHTNDMFYDIEILNSTSCLISGWPTALIKSIDTGSSFFNLVSRQNQHIALLSFIDENIGFACKIWDGGPNPTLKTTNGGLNWDTLPHLNHNTVMETMSFISESVGFKGGWYNGNLQKTTDSADSWSSVTFVDSLTDGQIFDFHIEQNMPNSYYACGWYGQLFKSTDGGDNWFTLNSGLSSNTSLFGIYFISDSVGWAVGANGTIIKTINGGQTVGLTAIEKVPNFTLFPNPTKDWLNIDAPSSYEIKQIEIYNLSGQKLPIKSHANQLDLTPFPNGLYMIAIETNKGRYSGKILKE